MPGRRFSPFSSPYRITGRAEQSLLALKCCTSSHSPADALARFVKATDLNPRLAEGWAGQGWTHYDQQRYQDEFPHEVVLTKFYYMSETPVTQEVFSAKPALLLLVR